MYAISVISPTGERIPKVSLRSGASKSFRFVFEGTTVSVDYRIETKETANQLIYLRFSDVRRGLWIVRVYPENIVSGNYNMWLPMQKLTDGNVIFLRSNPDTTLTAPGRRHRSSRSADTRYPITACMRIPGAATQWRGRSSRILWHPR